MYVPKDYKCSINFYVAFCCHHYCKIIRIPCQNVKKEEKTEIQKSTQNIKTPK
jgi:hypothetical protein